MVSLHTLTDYHTLIDVALASGDIQPGQVNMLEEWRKNPEHWQGENK